MWISDRKRYCCSMADLRIYKRNSMAVWVQKKSRHSEGLMRIPLAHNLKLFIWQYEIKCITNVMFICSRLVCLVRKYLWLKQKHLHENPVDGLRCSRAQMQCSKWDWGATIDPLHTGIVCGSIPKYSACLLPCHFVDCLFIATGWFFIIAWRLHNGIQTANGTGFCEFSSGFTHYSKQWTALFVETEVRLRLKEHKRILVPRILNCTSFLWD